MGRILSANVASFHIGRHQWDRTRGRSATYLSYPLASPYPLNTNHVPCSLQRFLLFLQLSIGPQCRTGGV